MQGYHKSPNHIHQEKNIISKHYHTEKIYFEDAEKSFKERFYNLLSQVLHKKRKTIEKNTGKLK